MVVAKYKSQNMNYFSHFELHHSMALSTSILQKVCGKWNSKIGLFWFKGFGNPCSCFIYMNQFTLLENGIFEIYVIDISYELSEVFLYIHSFVPLRLFPSFGTIFPLLKRTLRHLKPSFPTPFLYKFFSMDLPEYCTQVDLDNLWSLPSGQYGFFF